MSPKRPIIAGLAASAAVACPLLAGGVGSAAAEPAPAEPPRGMPMVVDDVLQPGDPDFWNLAVRGTRVLTPLAAGDEVSCSAGFDPPVSCSTLDMYDLSSAQRVLEHVDVPVPGAAPVRVWFDLPRWGDGSTAGLDERVAAGFAGA